MQKIKERAKHRWAIIKSYIALDDYVAIILVIIGVTGFINAPLPYVPVLTNIFVSLRTELIGLGLAVLIIANANETISRNTEKDRLALQMSSPDIAFSNEAVRQLKARGWLSDGSLKGKNLVGANLSGAFLANADLSEVNLSEAKLDNANLMLSKLNGAKLKDAAMDDTNLYGADLRGADLEHALITTWIAGEITTCVVNLDTALFNKETIWPDGFDPQAVGAILVED